MSHTLFLKASLHIPCIYTIYLKQIEYLAHVTQPKCAHNHNIDFSQCILGNHRNNLWYTHAPLKRILPFMYKSLNLLPTSQSSAYTNFIWFQYYPTGYFLCFKEEPTDDSRKGFQTSWVRECNHLFIPSHIVKLNLITVTCPMAKFAKRKNHIGIKNDGILNENFAHCMENWNTPVDKILQP